MPDPPRSSPALLPLLPNAVLVPAAVLAVAALGLAWQWRRVHVENAALRGEIASMVLARREAASQEGLAADALRRSARLGEALALMRQEPAPAEPAEAGRAAELERVIAFLREEITAAQETITRLKQDEPPPRPGRP